MNEENNNSRVEVRSIKLDYDIVDNLGNRFSNTVSLLPFTSSNKNDNEDIPITLKSLQDYVNKTGGSNTFNFPHMSGYSNLDNSHDNGEMSIDKILKELCSNEKLYGTQLDKIINDNNLKAETELGPGNDVYVGTVGGKRNKIEDSSDDVLCSNTNCKLSNDIGGRKGKPPKMQVDMTNGGRYYSRICEDYDDDLYQTQDILNSKMNQTSKIFQYY